MKKWLGNISFTFAGKVIAMVFLMLLDIVAARLLQIELYAEWVYFFTILTMMFYVGWCGINSSAKVNVSKLNDNNERLSCISSAVLIRFIVSGLFSIIIYAIIPYVVIYLGNQDKYPNLRNLLSLAPLLVFLNSFTDFYKELCTGLSSFVSLFVITVIEYLGYFVFSSILLLLMNSSSAIAFGYMISGFIILIVGFLLVLRTMRRYDGEQSNVISKNIENITVSMKNYAFPIVRYAIPFAFISIGGMILVEIDTFMLGLLSTNKSVAVYSIAKNLCTKARHINYSLITGIMTSFSLITVDNYLQKRKSFKKAVAINTGITLAVVGGFIIFGRIFISIMYGSEYIEAAHILVLLSVYYMLDVIATFFGAFLDFRKKTTIRSIAYSSIIIINVVLNYTWIPKYGPDGAAFATVISLIPYTLCLIYVSYREWKYNITQKYECLLEKK